MKRSLVLALLVIATSSIASVAPAETTITRTAPYDVGLVCYERIYQSDYPDGFGPWDIDDDEGEDDSPRIPPRLESGGRYKCITDPYTGNPDPLTNPLDDKMFVGIATAAHFVGALGGGGKTHEEWWDCDHSYLFGHFYYCYTATTYYAAIRRIETHVIAGFAPSNGTITATADLTGISADVTNVDHICLQILEWNNVAGQSCVQDGFSGTLTATATTSVTANYKIIVSYDSSGYSNHSVGAVRVGSISYAW